MALLLLHMLLAVDSAVLGDVIPVLGQSRAKYLLQIHVFTGSDVGIVFSLAS